MIKEREIWVEENLYQVVMSDEREALLAAKAAGRVVVGLLQREGGDEEDNHTWETGNELPFTRYVVEDPEVEDAFLERVVRRELGLPWRITETDRLLIREFMTSDIGQVVKEANDTVDDAVFYTPKLLESYIREQYGFCECGMWALVRKKDGRLIGKAGVTPGRDPDGNIPCLELGYHIFTPYRRQGYAKEACRGILEYAGQVYEEEIVALTDRENLPSIRLLGQLGFRFTGRIYSGSALLRFRYVRN